MVEFIIASALSFIIVVGTLNFKSKSTGIASGIGAGLYLIILFVGSLLFGPIAGPALGLVVYLLIRFYFVTLFLALPVLLLCGMKAMNS